MTTLQDLDKLNAYFCTKGDWYPDGLYWRDVADDWQIRVYGAKSNGKGDLISNTCMKIIFHNNKTPWAYKSLDAMKELLMDRRRWPERMDHENDACCLPAKWWNSIAWFLTSGGIQKKFRPVGGMTRDLYIFFYALCIFLDRKEYIAEVKPVWYNWRPSTWAWRKTLIRRNRWNDFWYRKKKAHKHFYVTRLREFKEYAYHNA
jgi:hypothetical protein